MSKTIDLQIEKCCTLIESLRNNLADIVDKGINAEQLEVMKQNVSALKEASSKCDALREDLSSRVKLMNQILKTVKDEFFETKRIIKTNYPQETWLKYGIQDKR